MQSSVIRRNSGPAEAHWIIIQTVSYTHLDVYKRQASDYANAMLQNLKIMYENVARGEKSPADSIQAMYDSMKAISGE